MIDIISIRVIEIALICLRSMSCSKFFKEQLVLLPKVLILLIIISQVQWRFLRFINLRSVFDDLPRLAQDINIFNLVISIIFGQSIP